MSVGYAVTETVPWAFRIAFVVAMQECDRRGVIEAGNVAHEVSVCRRSGRCGNAASSPDGPVASLAENRQTTA